GQAQSWPEPPPSGEVRQSPTFERELRLLHRARDPFRFGVEKHALALEVRVEEILIVVGERQGAEHLRWSERRVALDERLDRDPLAMPCPEAADGNLGFSHDGAAAEEVVTHLHVRMMNANGREAAHGLPPLPPFARTGNKTVSASIQRPA